MRKVCLFLTVILMLTLCFTGCSTAPKELDHDTAYPLGAAEYQMNVNHKLAPLISCLQPLANTDNIDEATADQTLSKIQEVYDGIAALNPPKDKALYQADLLNDLTLAAENVKYRSGKTDAAPDTSLEDALTRIENAFHVSVN